MSQQPGNTTPNAPQQQNPYSQAPQQGYLPPPPPEEPKKSWFARHKILTGIGAVIALIVVISAFSGGGDRKSTRLNSRHVAISYAVFCLKKKKQKPMLKKKKALM